MLDCLVPYVILNFDISYIVAILLLVVDWDILVVHCNVTFVLILFVVNWKASFFDIWKNSVSIFSVVRFVFLNQSSIIGYET